MSVQVRDRSVGMKRFLAALDELEHPPKVTVGVHADTGAEEHRGPTRGVTVADVATILEFGGGESSPTAFLRGTIDGQRAQLEKGLSSATQRALKSALYGTAATGHVHRALGRVAARAQRLVKAAVSRAGMTKTGHLLESIEGRVGGQRVTEAA